MIAFVKGVLAECRESSIVIENGGIGTEVFVPASLLPLLPSLGEEVFVYTHLRVAEDDLSLYGFLEKRDLLLFKRLLLVGGISPKGAMALLSALGGDDLILSILSEDDKAIAKAPGIGPKTAKRIIFDLKDKVSFGDADGFFGEYPKGAGAGGLDRGEREAIEALQTLGYGLGEATRAVRMAAENSPEANGAEMLLKEALKLI